MPQSYKTVFKSLLISHPASSGQSHWPMSGLKCNPSGHSACVGTPSMHT